MGLPLPPLIRRATFPGLGRSTTMVVMFDGDVLSQLLIGVSGGSVGSIVLLLATLTAVVVAGRGPGGRV